VSKTKKPKCSVCADKNRCAIDESYIKTADIRGTARKFHISEDALGRHISNGHISKAVQAAEDSKLIEHGINLQSSAQEIYDLCLRAANKAEKKDLRSFGSCISPAVKVLEILSKGSEGGKKSTAAIDIFIEELKREASEDEPQAKA
jgi:hypothetical protein